MKHTKEDLILITNNIKTIQKQLNSKEFDIVDCKLVGRTEPTTNPQISIAEEADLWVELLVYFDDYKFDSCAKDILNYHSGISSIKYRNATHVEFNVETLNMYGSLHNLLEAELNYYREHNKGKHKTVEERLTEIMEGE